MSKRMLGNAMLLAAAMIWGAAFVAQTVGMDYVGPFTFQAARYFLGGIVLLPVIAIMDQRGNAKKPVTAADQKYLAWAGLGCGLILFAACTLQQLSLLYIEAGKSGFITSLYIILVPVAGLFFGRKVRPWVWGSVALALVGSYLLCGGVSVGKGELLVFGSAILFTAHILLIDHVSPRVDGVRLSCIQFLIASSLSVVFMFLLETPTWQSVLQCWLPICYAGILSAGVGYTFQILGQAYTEPTVASLLMSLESVFSMLFGWLLLHQVLSPKELAGCGLVFAGVILAQLPERRPAHTA